MSMLTRLVLLLTVLALLPLGSFAPKFGTGPRTVAVISAQLDDITVAPTATEPTATEKTFSKTFASGNSRCKGPALPGSPCNPALAVWPTELTFAFSSPARVLHPAAWSPKPGQTPPLALGPPRLG